jgi:hypothetical protein
MTYREIINSVLRRLREDTIDSDWSGDLIGSTGPTDYQVMIGDFVNEVKREVEDAWDWTSLRRTETVATVSGTRTYNLPSTTQRTRIISVQEQGKGGNLSLVPYDWIKRMRYPTEVSSIPSHFSIVGTSSGLLTTQLYPKADAVYSVDFHLIDPQDNLTAATTALIAPEYPIILGVWARAIAERGEDGGALSDMAQLQYSQALADSISQDAGRHTSEVTWNAV